MFKAPEEMKAGLYDEPALYDLLLPPGPCEAFYRRLAREAAGSVLELACGTGRLTLALAGGKWAVTGLDASEAMLGRARAKAAAAGLPVQFVLGDMRQFRFPNLFSLIILSCNSLGHLLDDGDLSACLASVRRHLAPGGTFAFDVVNPHAPALLQASGAWRRIGPAPEEPDAALEELAQVDPDGRARTVHWRLRGSGGRARALAPMRLRQFPPNELEDLLQANGFRLAARYGGFAGEALDCESFNQVCLARTAG